MRVTANQVDWLSLSGGQGDSLRNNFSPVTFSTYDHLMYIIPYPTYTPENEAKSHDNVSTQPARIHRIDIGLLRSTLRGKDTLRNGEL